MKIFLEKMTFLPLQELAIDGRLGHCKNATTIVAFKKGGNELDVGLWCCPISSSNSGALYYTAKFLLLLLMVFICSFFLLFVTLILSPKCHLCTTNFHPITCSSLLPTRGATTTILVDDACRQVHFLKFLPKLHFRCFIFLVYDWRASFFI
jgi:hypothetical protein